MVLPIRPVCTVTYPPGLYKVIPIYRGSESVDMVNNLELNRKSRTKDDAHSELWRLAEEK